MPGLEQPFALAPATPVQIYPALKRLLDLAVAVPMLVITAPVLLAIALWIRLDSKGPVLFRQTRLGLGGRPFGIVKFRTMNVRRAGGPQRCARHQGRDLPARLQPRRAAAIAERDRGRNVAGGTEAARDPRTTRSIPR